MNRVINLDELTREEIAKRKREAAQARWWAVREACTERTTEDADLIDKVKWARRVLA